MLSKPLAFGLVAAACVVAAGGGAYIATLQHEKHDSALAASATSPTAAAPTNSAAPQSPADVQEPPAHAAAALPALPAPDEAPAAQSGAGRDASKPSAKAAGRIASPVPSASRSRQADAAKKEESSQAATGQTAQVQQPPAPIPAPTDVPEAKEQPRAEPERVWHEVTVQSDSVIGLQLETPLNSETAHVEDRVDARVTRDVHADGEVAIPAGSHAIGSVILVERGGKIKERARLGIRFNTLVLPDATRVSLTSETVYREGDPPSASSSKKIGGAAIGGAILGAILGGGKGAAIGGGIGAAGGTAAAMAGDRKPVVLPVGTPVTIRTQAPFTVTVEK